MVIIRKVNESYLKIECELDVARLISDKFSFMAANYHFMKKSRPNWNGRIKLFDYRTNLLPAGCYDKLISLLDENGYDHRTEGEVKKEFNVTDESLRTFMTDRLKVDTSEMNQEQLEYQIDAALMTFKNNKNIILLPTGAGKSFAQFLVANKAIAKGFKKILMIVPTINLVNQMEFDFLDYGKNIQSYGDLIHKIYSGQEKTSNKKIHISTWQSLSSIMKSKLTLPNGEPWLSQFDCLLVDEVHGAESGVQLANIVSSCVNAKIKLGMTGTLSGDKIKREQIEALFGPILFVSDRETNKDIDTNLLIEKGILTDYDIKMLVFKYPEEEKKKFNSELKRIKKELGEKFPDGIPKKDLQLAKYNFEMDYLKGSKIRTRKLLQLVKATKGNTLVLFKNVEYGEYLAELADKYTGKKVYLIHGSINKDERERIRQVIDTETDVILFGSTQILSTGINIKSLSHLIFSQGSKGRIKIFQSLGRLLRKFEGKYSSKFIDIVDDINGKNFSYQHALVRIDLYDEQASKYSIKEIYL